ncbi:hypothetical protein ACFL1X_00160 [Candidatus Hydrogenedentota bacterium]
MENLKYGIILIGVAIAIAVGIRQLGTVQDSALTANNPFENMDTYNSNYPNASWDKFNAEYEAGDKQAPVPTVPLESRAYGYLSKQKKKDYFDMYDYLCADFRNSVPELNYVKFSRIYQADTEFTSLKTDNITKDPTGKFAQVNFSGTYTEGGGGAATFQSYHRWVLENGQWFRQIDRRDPFWVELNAWVASRLG